MDQSHEEPKASVPRRRQTAELAAEAWEPPGLYFPVPVITEKENVQATAPSVVTESSGKVDLLENAS